MTDETKSKVLRLSQRCLCVEDVIEFVAMNKIVPSEIIVCWEEIYYE